MRAAALFVRHRVGGLRGIVQQAQDCHLVRAERVEIILFQVQRQGHAAHQRGGEAGHGGKVRFQDRAEGWQGRRPLIGAVIEQAGDNARIRRRQILADVEAFLEIGRRAGFQNLITHLLVAAVAGGEGFIDQKLLFHRQGEEALYLRQRGRLQLRRNAVMGDVEEAGVGAGLVQLAGDGALFRGAGVELAHVDNGQGHRTLRDWDGKC